MNKGVHTAAGGLPSTAAAAEEDRATSSNTMTLVRQAHADSFGGCICSSGSAKVLPSVGRHLFKAGSGR